MPKYGFLIDNRKCIGCHACTVACKQEHEVPLGRFRTWVKYVESGAFPQTRRHFSVMRCNHCERPPCVEICPVTALFKRVDGIVDFDPEVCIGCKACMQACPYDALYIHDDTGAAHKCNFCAHRIEAGREPPCVTVCPEQAIVMGDLDDPESLISRLIASEPTTVRAPEKATRPKLYYIDGRPASLEPLQAPPRAEYVWSQAAPAPIPLTYTPEELAALATRVYDVGHARPWGWRVSAYLTTKSIASGAFLVPALLWLLGGEAAGMRAGAAGSGMALGPSAGAAALVRTAGGWAPVPLEGTASLVRTGAVLGLLFLALTAVLLVADLKRPVKFLSIMLRPQWRSWLVLGSFVLMGYGGVLAAYLATGLVPSGGLDLRVGRAALTLLGIPLAALTACYTAWLFRQCEARDLWHAPLLPWHLVSQAVLAGAAVTLLVQPAAVLKGIMLLALAADLVVFYPFELMEKWGQPPDPRDAGNRSPEGLSRDLVAVPPFPPTRAYREAAAIVTRGALRGPFWLGAVGVGHLLPFDLLLFWPHLCALPALFALAGLAIYEHVFVTAGQAVPLS